MHAVHLWPYSIEPRALRVSSSLAACPPIYLPAIIGLRVLPSVQFWSLAGRADFTYWRNQLASLPGRALMTFALRWVPHQEHDGIMLIVAHRWLKAGAPRIFDRTSEALTIAAADAPTAYAAFQRDVRQIVVTLQPVATPFQRFQMAVVAPAPIALQSSLPEYITWLLHTSAFMHGPDEAHRRTAEFLASLGPDERIRVSAWLDSALQRETAAAPIGKEV